MPSSTKDELTDNCMQTIMAGFAPTNVPGSYFESQANSNVLDFFAVIGLHADDSRLTQRGIAQHIKKVVKRHVFQRGEVGAKTQGAKVPAWSHVNVVEDAFREMDRAAFKTYRTAWNHSSVQTWDPFQEPGSPEALQAPASRRQRMQFPRVGVQFAHVACSPRPLLRLCRRRRG